MITGKELTWIGISYLLGCFTVGYYWVRCRTGEDIRHYGSGNVGAKNVGRRLGSPAFCITFLGDLGKGVLAVSGAVYLDLSSWATVASILAVVAGHNWPFQLRFEGGKGIAVSLGALIAYDLHSVATLVAVFLAAYLLLRNFTLSGLLAFALAPLAIFFWDQTAIQVVTLSLLALLILIAHRRNLREEIARIFTSRSVKDSRRRPQKGAAS